MKDLPLILTVTLKRTFQLSQRLNRTGRLVVKAIAGCKPACACFAPVIFTLLLSASLTALGQRGPVGRQVVVITPVPQFGMACTPNPDTNTTVVWSSTTNLLDGQWSVIAIGTNVLYVSKTNPQQFFRVSSAWVLKR